MRENPLVVDLLHEIRKLLELKGENIFKIRAFEKAEILLSTQGDLMAHAKKGTLTTIPGIGKGIAEVISDFLLTGQSRVRDELIKSLPEGLLELTEIPGIGPKKAMILIQELGIQSVSELEYACSENRLILLKGFGAKVQDRILKEIAFKKAYQGQQRLSDALRTSEIVKKSLQGIEQIQVFETGAIRRRREVIAELEYLILVSKKVEVEKKEEIEGHLATLKIGLPVRFYLVDAPHFGFEWVRTTATLEHWQALKNLSTTSLLENESFETEEAFYQSLGLPWIFPEGRETGEEIAIARAGKIEHVLAENGVFGVFHNHTTRSDGSSTLEEMVLAARKLRFEYIGISDHSQTAVYASGLKTEALWAQKKEIIELQKRIPEIRIFWGVESDILADGSLDYEPEVLREFDFVVASVHSRFQMEKSAMTERVLTAIKNPYTTFLGHATGRLLLGRKGFELDMVKVIEEASLRRVAIEINANPARLDIDWRWGSHLRKNQTFVSVNPDAHDTEGLSDTRFGIMMARKALLPRELVVNSRNVKEVEQWLKSRVK